MIWFCIVGSLFVIFTIIYFIFIIYDKNIKHCRKIKDEIRYKYNRYYMSNSFIEKNLTDKEKKMYKRANKKSIDSAKHWLLIVIIPLLTALFIMIFTVMVNQLPRFANNSYENWMEERTSLEYRLSIKDNNNTTGNELLYNDIVQFNNRLRDYKYGRESKWTNIWHVQKIADIDYIIYTNTSTNE